MGTDTSGSQFPNQNIQGAPAQLSVPVKGQPADTASSNLTNLIDAMKVVNVNCPDVALNAHSIGDGNGGQIGLMTPTSYR